ncbi:MAG TPA: metal ABC transporter permease [Leptospiraceae bacterium]|nr:metal ABC transporter permease [Leptospiraceae bacterium]HMY69001.1 metal ABC transporter permease [Leptospiraceae bacterium]HMZ58909.1 metal ABC transporter permease [Leptospiraceae bacterium]HNF14840.1 metal ABC transporter permease [Leptospiraceae bacterium]HNF23115.1 metal ABC transporter permease [Leptospiraceae bacterium]
MENLTGSLALFWPQLILGAVLGALLSSFGIILLLRNMSFYSITLAQITTFGFAAALFFRLPAEIFTPVFTSVIMLLSVYLTAKTSYRTESVLAILFVSFGAMSQALLAFGGNVQNHILSAYFGDILTSQVRLDSPVIFITLGCAAVFFISFRMIYFYSFDREEYILQNYSKGIYIIFLLLLSTVLSFSVNLLGSFYSAAQLLIPGFLALSLFQEIHAVILFSVLFSIFSTAAGFTLSLTGIKTGQETVFLPTSSTIIIVLSIVCGMGIILKKIIKK